MASKPPQEELRDEGQTHQYTDKLPTDITLARKVLENYSGIAPDQVIPHILAIHAKAILHPDPYPCLTSFRYLQFHISTHPLYTHILSRLTSPTSPTNLLDLGTFFGQDLRIFAADGARIQNLYGVDLHPEFIDLGFELFRDREAFKGRVGVGDIFGTANGLERLHGKMDIISATAFLHLFTWEEQLYICCRMIDFLKPIPSSSTSPDISNTTTAHQTSDHNQDPQIIFGRQSATTHPGPRVRPDPKWGRREIYLHDFNSFKKLWEEVGRKTGTKWEVRGELRGVGREGVRGIEEGARARLLVFSVWRVDGGGDCGGGRGVDRMDLKLKHLRVESLEGGLEEEKFADELIEDGAI